VAVFWGDVPDRSSFVGSWLQPWQQSWEQSNTVAQTLSSMRVLPSRGTFFRSC
jgi:hypothetical protein